MAAEADRRQRGRTEAAEAAVGQGRAAVQRANASRAGQRRGKPASVAGQGRRKPENASGSRRRRRRMAGQCARTEPGAEHRPGSGKMTGTRARPAAQGTRKGGVRGEPVEQREKE